MGYIEIFRLDEQGAGWVDLSEATPQELLDLEIGLFQEGALQGVSIPKLSVAQVIITLTTTKGKLKWEI